MDPQEFQSKELLSNRGIPVPRGGVAWTADEAARIARDLAAQRFVVKAQVTAGGRAEAGGVRIAATSDAVRREAAALLGSTLVTRETGSKGRQVRCVAVEEALSLERELYVAVLLDRRAGRMVLAGAREGGTGVEDRVARDSEALATLPVGLPPDIDAIAGFAVELGLDATRGGALLVRLVETAFELDATQIEINPLGLTGGGDMVAIDLKVTVDDNALGRHPELAALRDESADDAIEMEAQRHDINLVRMDGSIGVVVNGAGLALATHDLIADAGGQAANFMDLRTTATSLQIARGIGLVLSDPRVRALLVNIHGGGMTRCDTIAEAINFALHKSGRRVPLVVRFAGQNADHAYRLLKDRRIAHEATPDLRAATARVVALAKGA